MKACMAWGCDHGNGWYRLLYETCLKIEQALKDNPKNKFQFDQIKEKVWDFKIIYIFMGNKEVDKIILDAEDKSGEICEICW